MLVLQLITQVKGEGTVVRRLAFGELLVTYTDATRSKPETMVLGTEDSWRLTLSAETAELIPPPKPDPIEVILPEDRDIVVSSEVHVDIDINMTQNEPEPVEVAVNQSPDLESSDVGNGYTLTKELEEPLPTEEVLAVVIKNIEYPVTAFEEIVHLVLAE